MSKITKPSFGFNYRLLAIEESGRFHISDWVPTTVRGSESAEYVRNQMMNLPFRSHVVYNRDGEVILGFMRPEDIQRFQEAFQQET